MRALPEIVPSAEQLTIMGQNRPGVEIIRGAAGSGKTTTAILRLRALAGFYLSRRHRTLSNAPVRILVLTYNRTLRGYVRALVGHQFDSSSAQLEVEVTTFARWARQMFANPTIVLAGLKSAKLRELIKPLGIPFDFGVDELEYVLGRFLPQDLDRYLEVQRAGRGPIPRMVRATREQLLKSVVGPYQTWLDESGYYDWHEFAVVAATKDLDEKYDIIIVDETQDFSANQIRAILRQRKAESSVTFVVDTVQRIYARGFTWAETGLIVRPEMVRSLVRNYRNTKQIARVATQFCKGIKIDDDGTLPDFAQAVETGPKPILLKGKYSDQVAFAIKFIKREIDLKNQSVAFLHPKGWFDYLQQRLDAAKLAHVSITRESEWPDGPENIACCTMHSAKGLEFDCVIILGLNAETLGEYEEEEDDRALKERRLMAMAVSRAKTHLIVGYKPEEQPDIVDLIEEKDFEVIDV